MARTSWCLVHHRGGLTVVAVTFGLVLALIGNSVARSAHRTGCAPALHYASNGRFGQGAVMPAGVSALLLCRYNGIGGARKPFDLLRSARIVKATKVRALVREMNSLPNLQRGTKCPKDDGAAILVRGTRNNGKTVKVKVGLSGCQIVTNGVVTRTASASPLIEELRQAFR